VEIYRPKQAPFEDKLVALLPSKPFGEIHFSAMLFLLLQVKGTDFFFPPLKLVSTMEYSSSSFPFCSVILRYETPYLACMKLEVMYVHGSFVFRQPSRLKIRKE
jgi:hypothetical protein